MNPFEHHNRNCASLARLIFFLTLAAILSTTITAQQQTAKLDSVVGAVVAINSASRSATIKSDAGAVTIIQTDDHTICLRIPAGEKSLAKANSIKFSEIAVGDRVLAHG